jgi:hypothetical protein
MFRSWEERAVKITATPDGAPAVWERGGYSNGKGEAVVIADSRGGKPYAQDLRSEPCSEHALVKVEVGYYLVVVTVRQKILTSMRIDLITGLSEADATTASVQTRAQWTLDAGWDYPSLVKRLAEAVTAAGAKQAVRESVKTELIAADQVRAERPPKRIPRLIEFKSQVEDLERELTGLRQRDPSVPRLVRGPTRFSLDGVLKQVLYHEENINLVRQEVRYWRQEFAARDASEARERAAKLDARLANQASKQAKKELEPRLKKLQAAWLPLRRKDPRVPRLELRANHFIFGQATNIAYSEKNVAIVEKEVAYWSRVIAARNTAKWFARRPLEDRLRELIPRLKTLRAKDRSVPMIRLWPGRFGFGDVLASVPYTDEHVRVVEQWVEERERREPEGS